MQDPTAKTHTGSVSCQPDALRYAAWESRRTRINRIMRAAKVRSNWLIKFIIGFLIALPVFLFIWAASNE